MTRLLLTGPLKTSFDFIRMDQLRKKISPFVQKRCWSCAVKSKSEF